MENINTYNTINNMIVEDGYNTSYISTLLIGLFYQNSNIYDILLEMNPDNIYFIYLQEIIKQNFIEQIKKNIYIQSNILNEIRNFIFLNNFHNYSDILEEHNICDLWQYLQINLYNKPLIINNMNVYYININLKSNKTIYTVKDIINEWLVDNTIYLKNDFQGSSVPQIVPIYLNKENHIKIDINEKIKLSNTIKFKWIIHSVICKNPITQKYYVLIRKDLTTNKKGNIQWLLFDNNSIPSFKEVIFTNKDIVDKIMQDAFFLIYRYFS